VPTATRTCAIPEVSWHYNELMCHGDTKLRLATLRGAFYSVEAVENSFAASPVFRGVGTTASIGAAAAGRAGDPDGPPSGRQRTVLLESELAGLVDLHPGPRRGRCAQ
jgi:hypothetical protein